MNSGTRSDLVGRIIGMLVFLIGVGLLLWVFYIAYGLFTKTGPAALGLTFTGDPKKDPTAVLIGSQFALLLFRIVYLFLMAIAGSMIANKGINLYFSALQGSPLHVLTRDKTAPPTEVNHP